MQPTRLAAPLDLDTSLVCVVMPTRNEADHIADSIQAVLNQTFPHARMVIRVVDGMSTDGTREIVQALQKQNAHLCLLDNLRHTTPSALNMGIESTSADVIVRVDGHCLIAPTYVSRCVRLLAESRAANVGGPMRPDGQGMVGNAIARAMRSRFGIGNARFHYLEREEYVDTVYLGAFRRDVLGEIGGFDEELIRNQDDELNYRIRQAGYGILLSPEIVSTYRPRNSLRSLWRQFYGYGWWKVRVIEKHPTSVQARHLAPPMLVAVLLASLCSFIALRVPVLLLPFAIYALPILALSLWIARDNLRLAPALAAVLPTMHLGYGCGFVLALLCRFVFALRVTHRAAKTVT